MSKAGCAFGYCEVLNQVVLCEVLQAKLGVVLHCISERRELQQPSELPMRPDVDDGPPKQTCRQHQQPAFLLSRQPLFVSTIGWLLPA
jgi:hypothetical protein